MLRDRASQLIRTAREDMSMTQAALARAAGIHQPTLAAYESGRRVPREETLRRILTAAKTRPSVPLGLLADEIIQLASNRGLTNVRVFGSTVRGQDTERSDIDLLVSTDESTSLFDLSAFVADVEELTGFTVDILTEDHTHNPYFTRVLEEAVPL